VIIDRLDEEVLLFSLRRNGRWVSRWTGSVSAGVAGAWLLELLLEGRLKLRHDHIIHRGKSSMDDPVLDSVLEQIRAARKPRSVARWVTRLSRRTGRRVLKVMHRLEERGYVDHKSSIGFLQRHHRFPMHSAGSRSEMRQYLLDVVDGKMIPSEDAVALLCLLDAAGMTRHVFGRKAGPARRVIRALVPRDLRVAAVAHAVRRRRARRFYAF